MKQKIKDVAFILILGSISTSMIIGLRSYTLPMIQKYEALMLKSSIMDAAGISFESENMDELFEQNIRKIEKDDFVYYISPSKSYIFEFLGRGLWGMISGVITLNPDLETIENINIISQEETPGLGARITEKEFLDSFKNKKFSPKLELVLRKSETENNEIDAITGATMTSDALIIILNDSTEEFLKNIRKNVKERG